MRRWSCCGRASYKICIYSVLMILLQSRRDVGYNIMATDCGYLPIYMGYNNINTRWNGPSPPLMDVLYATCSVYARDGFPTKNKHSLDRSDNTRVWPNDFHLRAASLNTHTHWYTDRGLQVSLCIAAVAIVIIIMISCSVSSRRHRKSEKQIYTAR